VSNIITDFVAAELAWIDGPPTMNAIGATSNSRAVVRNAAHQVLVALTPTYTSLGTGVATINSSGLVTAVSNGTATLQASYAGVTSITQTATVSQVVASISGVASTLSTDDSSSGTFSPVAKDANNNTVSGATFSYSSSQPSVFSVNASTGAWAGQSAGSATITITCGSVTFTVSVTVIHATFTIQASPSPIYIGTNVTFTTQYNGVDDTAGSSFTTSAPSVLAVDAPTLTGAPSPASITQGTGPITVTFPCTNPRATQTLGGLTSGLSAGSATVVDGTHISFPITATGAATVGNASVYLIDSTHGNSGTQTLTVTVTAATPTLTSVSPSALSVGATSQVVTLTGTNFDNNCTAVFSNAGITVNSYGTITSTSLPVNITISAGATPGAGTVKVHTTSGGGLDSGTQPFTVMSGAGVETLSVTSGLVLRMHAEAGVATSGSNVTSWTDQSATAAVFSQATGANQPTYVANAYVGKHCVRFNGSSQYLTAAAVVSALNLTQYTVLTVSRPSSLSAADQRVFSNIDGTAHTGFAIGYSNFPRYRWTYGDGATLWGPTGGTPSTSALHSFGFTAVPTGSIRETTYVDMTAVVTDGVTPVGNANIAPAIGTINTTPGSNLLNGDICEILVYNRVLTSGELASLKTDFNTAWGTP
jgi:hypothetical protein